MEMGVLLVAICSFFMIYAPTGGFCAGRFLNRTSQVVSPDGQLATAAAANYFAVQDTGPGDYHGFVATLDVYGFSLSPQQMSQACIWVFINAGDGAPSDSNYLQIGWHVSPFLYGDSKTHFYTLWTRDGTKGTGCYNTKCPGFRPEGGASIVPGAIIDGVTQLPNGVKQKLSLKLVKDSESGDWLLHYGLNKDAAELIGRFPKSIFTGLADKVTAMKFGGVVAAGGGQSLVPMGSGFHPPSHNAASFTNVQLIDHSDQASLVTWQLGRVMTDSNLYPITTIANGAFSYGGPS